MQFVKRKWGYYLTLVSHEKFKVKLLWFRKNSECSLQRHQYRNELWLFLSGKGDMWVGGKRNVMGYYDTQKGKFVPVPQDFWHQYKSEKSTLVLEIQYGVKCTEEDIERA